MGIRPIEFFDDEFILECKMTMEEELFKAWFEPMNENDIVGGYVETNWEQYSLPYKGKFYMVVALTYNPTSKSNYITIGSGEVVLNNPSIYDIQQALITGFIPGSAFEKKGGK